MRKLALIAVAATLLTSGTAAAAGPTEAQPSGQTGMQSNDNAGPLPPGKPAGITKAQALTATEVLYGLSIGLVGVGIALIASGGKAHHGTTTTTTTTATGTN